MEEKGVWERQTETSVGSECLPCTAWAQASRISRPTFVTRKDGSLETKRDTRYLWLDTCTTKLRSTEFVRHDSKIAAYMHIDNKGETSQTCPRTADLEQAK